MNKTYYFQNENFTYNYFLDSNVCRLCWQKDAKTNISSENDLTVSYPNRGLHNKIIECIDIDLNLPKSHCHLQNICSSCFVSICKFYTFKIFCQKSDDLLKKIINKRSSALDELDALNTSEEFLNPHDHPSCLITTKDDHTKSDAYDQGNVSLGSTYPGFDSESDMESYNMLDNPKAKRLDTVSADQIKGNETSNFRFEHISPEVVDRNFDKPTHVKEENSNEDRSEQLVKISGQINVTIKMEHTNHNPFGCHEAKTLEKHKKVKKKKKLKSVETYCAKCRTTFNSVSECVEHKREEHGIEERYRCFGCSVQLSSLQTREEHERACSRLQSGYRCVLCQRCLPTRKMYERHQKSHRKKREDVTDPLLKCRICPEIFQSKAERRRHMQRHKEASLTCETCHKQFSRQADLSRHKLTHSGRKLRESPTYCHICYTELHAADKLAEHQSQAHGVEAKNRYKCFGCEKRFTSSNLRLEHERKSCKALLNGYQCGSCDRYLPTRRKYSMHMKKHMENGNTDLPEDIFKCYHCKKRFDSKPDLTRHMETHQVPKSLICEVCGKIFSKRNYLVSHLATHTGVKQHVCGTCGYRTSQKNDLVVHNRKHTGERPYRCDLCDQRCVSNSNLQAHRRRHQGVKNFQCMLCPKQFGYKTSLEKHVLTVHQGTRSHICNICGSSYAYIRDLRRHLGSKHNICNGNVSQNASDSFEVSDPPVMILNRPSRHEGGALPVCNLCKAVFETSRGLKQHLVIKHNVHDDEVVRRGLPGES